jgi:hypothetical protein
MRGLLKTGRQRNFALKTWKVRNISGFEEWANDDEIRGRMMNGDYPYHWENDFKKLNWRKFRLAEPGQTTPSIDQVTAR